MFWRCSEWCKYCLIAQVLKRGYEDRLVIDETTYDHQGDYVCEAINAIGGQRKIVQSDPIHIEVRGKGGANSTSEFLYRAGQKSGP